MKIDLNDLPEWAVLQIKKGDLEVFANKLLKSRTTSVEVKTEEADEILSVDEAAKLLKIAKQTLYQMTSKNGIPFYKKNKLLYFRRSQLLHWIESGKQGLSNSDDRNSNNISNNKKN